MDTSRLELNEGEVEELTSQGPGHPMSALPAAYHLFLFSVSSKITARAKAQREVSARMEQAVSTPHRQLALEAELNWIKTYIARHISQWCLPDKANCWPIKHDALAQQFLLIARIRRKMDPSIEIWSQHPDLLPLAIEIFTEALSSPNPAHMTHRASILPLVAAVILKDGTRRDLVMRLALRMAPDPTRPSIPTFVRDAGCQMLSMLW